MFVVIMVISNSIEKNKISTIEEFAQHIVESVFDEEKEMSEEDKAAMDAKILRKLEMGAKLTKKEMDYLRRYNPNMYAHAMRVQAMAKAVEEQLKHARSKEEANRIVTTAITGISDKDPDKKYIVAAIHRVYGEFQKSPGYSRLPSTDEDSKKAHQSRGVMKKVTSDEEDDFDAMGWSPLQEVIDAMPKFEAGA